jgi:transposase-like protein
MTDSIIPRPAQNDNSLLGDQSDAMRRIFEHTLREIMQLEFDQHVGSGRYARSDGRLDQRNGTRHRVFDTRMGSLDLPIPRLREGNYFPSFLEHRTRSEEALVALVQEAFVGGVSTRKMGKLVAALGVKSLSKSQVSALCEDLDEQVRAFRERPLKGKYPYVFLDAFYDSALRRADNRCTRYPIIHQSGFQPFAYQADDTSVSDTKL